MIKGRGFSLLETLVVLLIIGIMFSVATLNVSDFGRHYYYRYQLEELASKIRLLREQAVLTNQIYGLVLKDNQAVFTRFTNNRWKAITKNKAFSSISFEQNLRLDLQKKSKGHTLYIYPDGMLTAFVLTLYQQNKQSFITKVRFDANGNYLVYPSEQQLDNNKL